jgi:hypothetical protein
LKILALDSSTDVGSVAVVVDGALQSELSFADRAPPRGDAPGLGAASPGRGRAQAGGSGPAGRGPGPGLLHGAAGGAGHHQGVGPGQGGAPGRGGYPAGPGARPRGGRRRGGRPDGRGAPWRGVRRRLRPARGGGGVGGDAPLPRGPDEAAQRLRDAVPDGTLALCGSGARRYRDILEQALGPGTVFAAPVWDAPRASLVALEAEARHARRGPDDLTLLEPLYLRPSDAKLPDRPLRRLG